MSGGGGRGFAQAPIAVGARSFPHQRWITIGVVERDWHATEPGNLEHRGWVETAADHIAAADLVVASTGNTTCQQILASGRPWLAVPEWRYFDEQHRKAEALAAVGAAIVRPHLPSSPLQWRAAVEETLVAHDGARADGTGRARTRTHGRGLDRGADRACMGETAGECRQAGSSRLMTTISVATLGHGRPSHLANLVRGLTRQTTLPKELVVAVMNGDRYEDIPAAPFPVRMVEAGGSGLRLAAARNAAAATASGDVLVFLDLDCIPGATLCADYAEAARDFRWPADGRGHVPARRRHRPGMELCRPGRRRGETFRSPRATAARSGDLC